MTIAKPELPQNFLDEYVKYASELTDAPIDFHRFIGYSVVSTVINNHVYFPFGDSRIYPNLWMILLAPSSIFRKSTAIAIGKRILHEFNKDLIFPSEFSQEKILEILSNYPQGTFIFYEFLTFMGLLQRDYMAGTKAFFTEMYDCPSEYSRVTKVSSYYVKQPFINILSASTLDWFLEQVRENDMAGGFLPRFIIIPGLRKEPSMPLPPCVDNRQTERLKRLLGKTLRPRGSLQFSVEARKEYELWYKKFEYEFHAADKRIQSFLVRLSIYLLKFSMLEAVCNYENSISLKSFTAARQAIQWITVNLKDISADIEFTRSGRQRVKILNLIKEASAAEGLPRHVLLKRSHIPSFEADRALKDLTEMRLITTKAIKSGDSHRTGLFYFYRNGYQQSEK